MLRIKKFTNLECIIYAFVVTKSITSIYFFSNIQWLGKALSMIELLMCAILFLRFIVVYGKLKSKEFIFIGILSLILMFCFLQNKSKMLIVALLLKINCKNERFEDVAKVVLYADLFIFFLSIILYAIGISDAGLARTYDAERAAVGIGFNHPNIAAEMIVLILMAWMCSQKRKEREILFLVIIAELFICIILKSRTPMLLLLLLVFLIFIRNIFLKSKFILMLILLIQPLLCLFSLSVNRIYTLPIIQKLDSMLAYRLFLINRQLNLYSLNMFGQKVNSSYGWLDNTYVTYALEYGVFSTLIYLIIMAVAIIKAYKNRQGEIIACAIVLIFYAFMENGFFEIFRNFILLFAIFTSKTRNISSENRKKTAIKCNYTGA